MKVILLETLDNLGRAGDIVDVKPGYANNYLIRQNLALPNTPENMNIVKTRRKAMEAKEAKLLEEAQALAARLEGEAVELKVKAGEGERLYGAVTAQDIAEALKQNGIEIDKRNVKLNEAIKELGEKDVEIRLHPDVRVQLKVSIVRDDA